MIKWFNIFLFFILWGLRLLSCLKSKKQNGSDSLPSLMGSYLVSTTQVLLSCIFLSEFLGEWLEVWTRGFIEDNVINGSFININSNEHQPVVSHIGKTVVLYRYDPRSSPGEVGIFFLCFFS